jgi:CheY-like chemotaxis protein
MASNRPSILVVASDDDERTRTVSMLRSAGFIAVAASAAGDVFAALHRGRFAAAVIALPEDHGIELTRRARRRQPELPMLLVLDPDALSYVDYEVEAVVRRPFDAWQLLGRVFDLVLRDGGDGTPHKHSAEYGIAAAKRACLYKRLACAAASGMGDITEDLSKQISETETLQRGVDASMPPVTLSSDKWAAGTA